MGGGEGGEGFGAGARLGRGLQGFQVDVEGWTVIQGLHTHPRARGDQHRFPHRLPAVGDTDADRAVGSDGGGHHGLVEHLGPEDLGGGAHRHVIARASPHQGHRGASHFVGPSHHLHLVATEAIGQQHQGAVGMGGKVFEAAGRLAGGHPQAARFPLPHAHPHGEPSTAQGPEHEAAA